jgi:hypothetical protein
MNAAQQELQAIRACLEQLRQGRSSVAALCQCALQSQSLPAALPAPYTTVLQELSNRLESSALFSEESCSFSQADLLASVQLWLDKAEQKLAAA